MTVTKVKQRYPGPQELPPSIWRRQLKSLGYWVLMAILAWLIYLPLIYLALRA